MALQVSRVKLWAAGVDDRPGALAEQLVALAGAGANLEFILARRSPERPGTGVVFLAPLTGPVQIRAARGWLAGSPRPWPQPTSTFAGCQPASSAGGSSPTSPSTAPPMPPRPSASCGGSEAGRCLPGIPAASAKDRSGTRPFATNPIETRRTCRSLPKAVRNCTELPESVRNCPILPKAVRN